ncbi:outer membrane beta-barrel protein [Vibrio algicola]|uniref:Outer membrane beta-barrel protein n=1 Tax=Vibrio algicola TaxID=2662262 RepID=A0A5Q0TK93_9VIBR|nr:outer membrane beta-barrel protein [Vibrio algicola]
MIKNSISILITTLAFSGFTFANENGAYIGGSLSLKSNFTDSGLSEDYQVSNNSSGGIEYNNDSSSAVDDVTGIGFSLYAGYYVNRVYGIELGYTQYGDLKNNRGEKTLSPASFSISNNLGWTFSNGLRPFVLIGLSAFQLHESSDSVYDEISGGGVGIHYGAGLEYQPTFIPHLTARLFYQADLSFVEVETIGGYTDYSDAYTLNTSAIMLGMAYKF